MCVCVCVRCAIVFVAHFQQSLYGVSDISFDKEHHLASSIIFGTRMVLLQQSQKCILSVNQNAFMLVSEYTECSFRCSVRPLHTNRHRCFLRPISKIESLTM